MNNNVTGMADFICSKGLPKILELCRQDESVAKIIESLFKCYNKPWHEIKSIDKGGAVVLVALKSGGVDLVRYAEVHDWCGLVLNGESPTSTEQCSGWFWQRLEWSDEIYEDTSQFISWQPYPYQIPE